MPAFVLMCLQLLSGAVSEAPGYTLNRRGQADVSTKLGSFFRIAYMDVQVLWTSKSALAAELGSFFRITLKQLVGNSESSCGDGESDGNWVRCFSFLFFLGAPGLAIRGARSWGRQ